MKKVLLFIVFALVFSFSSNAQLQVTDEGFVQVDFSPGDESLTFGENAGTSYPKRGAWAIEYYNGGLNFWRPWPNSNYGSYKLFIKDNGYVGINDATPSYRLDVNGDIATGGTLRLSSDERLKSDIKTITSSLENLKKLEGVSFKMKKFKKINSGIELENVTDPVKYKMLQDEIAMSEDSIPEDDRYGFIAQDLQKIYPELVDEDEDGFLNIDYIGIIPILVEAFKEQQIIIGDLEERILSIEENCCGASLKSASFTTDTESLLSENVAVLNQNIPNPFSHETRISCIMPDQYSSAYIYVYNMQGTQLERHQISGKGEQSITISGSSFTPGMYLYSLIIDGKEIDTKRMILTN